MSYSPLRAAFIFACVLVALCSLPFNISNARDGMTADGNAFSTLEQDVLRELNLARARPAEYAAYLEQWRPYFDGKNLKQPGKNMMTTEEGVAALDEAIRYLRAARPIGPLEMSQGMCSGARVLVSDQGVTGLTGHKGAKGDFCEQRSQQFGIWQDPIGENLSYGNDTARERVIALIIDDGVASRGHRKHIFDPAYKVAGIACGNHKLGNMCVITFAKGFSERLSAKQQPAGGGAAKSSAVPTTSVKRF